MKFSMVFMLVAVSASSVQAQMTGGSFGGSSWGSGSSSSSSSSSSSGPVPSVDDSETPSEYCARKARRFGGVIATVLEGQRVDQLLALFAPEIRNQRRSILAVRGIVGSYAEFNSAFGNAGLGHSTNFRIENISSRYEPGAFIFGTRHFTCLVGGNLDIYEDQGVFGSLFREPEHKMRLPLGITCRFTGFQNRADCSITEVRL